MLQLARHRWQMLLFVPDIPWEKYRRFYILQSFLFIEGRSSSLLPGNEKTRTKPRNKRKRGKRRKSETHIYSSIPIPMPFLVELIAENVISLNRGGGVRMKRARRHEIEGRICIFPCWFRVGSRATRGGTSTERRFLNRSGAYRARTTRGLKIRRIDRIITRT